jgi:hypothetical protein
METKGTATVDLAAYLTMKSKAEAFDLVDAQLRPIEIRTTEVVISHALGGFQGHGGRSYVEPTEDNLNRLRSAVEAVRHWRRGV